MSEPTATLLGDVGEEQTSVVGGCGRGIVGNCPETTMPQSRSRSRSRNPSRSPDRHYELPKDVSPISESDYFLKSAEFRVWLKDEKGKVCIIQP
jgi:hypothetical protein